MFRKIVFSAFVLASAFSVTQVQAQDPFMFGYGYSLSQSQRFRSNLPTPPYFSIYPPVYYGQRFYRPYGESPFASWPMLQPNPAYHPISADEEHARMSHLPLGCQKDCCKEKPPVASNAQGAPKMVTIVNPYATKNRIAMSE